MKKLTFLLALLIIYSSAVFAQIGFNNDGSQPDPSAGVDIKFSDKGLLVPRIALVQTSSASPVTSPVISLLVYNTETVNDVTPGYYYWGGTAWVSLSKVSESGKATYRWTTFSTYDDGGTYWACGNNAALFGGVPPSDWTNNSAVAAQMSPNKEVLRTLFVNKGYAKSNATIMNENYITYSSSNGKVVMAMFRVRNNTGSSINWIPYFYYSAYNGWGEAASVALNGVSMMNAGSSGNTELSLSIPANRVSTVIFVSTSGNLSGGYHEFYNRNCRLVFYNNSLELPVGLEFVDDLDTATGGWEQ